jgi:hypothetical protein
MILALSVLLLGVACQSQSQSQSTVRSTSTKTTSSPGEIGESSPSKTSTSNPTSTTIQEEVEEEEEEEEKEEEEEFVEVVEVVESTFEVKFIQSSVQEPEQTSTETPEPTLLSIERMNLTLPEIQTTTDENPHFTPSSEIDQEAKTVSDQKIQIAVLVASAVVFFIILYFFVNKFINLRKANLNNDQDVKSVISKQNIQSLAKQIVTKSDATINFDQAQIENEATLTFENNIASEIDLSHSQKSYDRASVYSEEIDENITLDFFSEINKALSKDSAQFYEPFVNDLASSDKIANSIAGFYFFKSSNCQ